MLLGFFPRFDFFVIGAALIVMIIERAVGESKHKCVLILFIYCNICTTDEAHYLLC